MATSSGASRSGFRTPFLKPRLDLVFLDLDRRAAKSPKGQSQVQRIAIEN
jgi:hypothetical protein